MIKASPLSLPSFLGIAASALLLAASPARATLFAYEGFDYSTGNLNTQNGGEGFSGAWTVGGDGTSWQVVSPGLTYAGLDTEGNAARASGNPQAFRNLSSSIGGSGSVYISFLLDQSAAGFGNITLFDSGNELFSFGDTYTGSEASATYSMYRSSGVGGGGYSSSGISINTTAAQLLVLEIDYSTPVDGANLYLYLNPTIGSTAPLHSSAVVSTSTSLDTASFTFDRIRLEGASVSTLDEIRIADDFASVVAVPEPAEFAVLIVAGCGLVAVVRRRRRCC